jgi:hypothetical protein
MGNVIMWATYSVVDTIRKGNFIIGSNLKGYHTYKRYWMWNISDYYGSGDIVAASEFYFYQNGVTASYLGVTVSGSGTVSNLIDGSTSSYWYTPLHIEPESQESVSIIFDFGKKVTFDSIDWVTSPGIEPFFSNFGDPYSYTIKVSDDLSNWTTLRTISGITATTSRSSFVGKIELDENVFFATRDQNEFCFYEYKPRQGPSIYDATQNSIVGLTNLKFTQSFTTFSEALQYLSTVDNVVVLDRHLESVDLNGLYLYYDMGFIPSYPRGGTAIYDISENLNHGTLLLGNSWNSLNGGNIDFNSNNFIQSSKLISNPQTFSICTWFKTSSASGLKMVGFENSLGTSSVTYDRQMYIGTDGKLYFGIFDTATRVVNSTSRVDDDVWHLGCGVFSNNQIKLYVDGVIVATQSTNPAFNLNGYWKVGGYSNAWTNGVSGYFNDNISSVLIYDKELSDTEIFNNYDLSKTRFRFDYGFSGLTMSWITGTSGFTVYSGPITNIDDGFASTPINIPTFFMNGTSYSTIYMSTNGFFSFGAGSGNIISSPQQLSNPPAIAGNPSDQWFNRGTTLDDGDVTNLWYKITNDVYRTKVEFIVFLSSFSARTSPRSFLMNIYRDSQYQWLETRVKSVSSGNVGPYNTIDVTSVASTNSKIWRSDLNGQNWQYMGVGSITST